MLDELEDWQHDIIRQCYCGGAERNLHSARCPNSGPSMFGKVQSPRYHRIRALERNDDLAYSGESRPANLIAILLFGATTFVMGLLAAQLGKTSSTVIQAWKILHSPCKISTYSLLRS